MVCTLQVSFQFAMWLCALVVVHTSTFVSTPTCTDCLTIRTPWRSDLFERIETVFCNDIKEEINYERWLCFVVVTLVNLRNASNKSSNSWEWEWVIFITHRVFLNTQFMTGTWIPLTLAASWSPWQPSGLFGARPGSCGHPDRPRSMKKEIPWATLIIVKHLF